MAHFSNYFQSPVSPANSITSFVMGLLARLAAKLKTKNTTKSDIPFLAEYSDAELADIGLLRAELSEELFTHQIDSQAQAMLRLYR